MNNQTFEEFYLKYRKISRGYAYGVLHDWSIADDVSQEEVAAFLEEQNSVDAEEVFLRKEKKEFMYMVLRRFRKKQPINYEILIQVKYLEISVETVAEEYGLTKSGINNRIYKAKRWLQEEFRKVYE